MVSNPPAATASGPAAITYPIYDSNMPFAKYIECCKQLIAQRRQDFNQYTDISAEQIITANSPFELYPTVMPHGSNAHKPYGALLIHGLFDCPFSMHDIALTLQANNILTKAILLPGHGTNPQDLLTVTYQDWVQAVSYGISSLRKEVDTLFLIGFSTGAALSIYHALQDDKIKGIILLSPAIKIKMPVKAVVNWHHLIGWASQKTAWIFRQQEIDYTKYSSVAFNPVTQIAKLTDVITQLTTSHPLTCPIFMVLSQEDETISSHAAINFFTQSPNKNSCLYLYAAKPAQYTDTRILAHDTKYPHLHISSFSHVCIPFAEDNIHYGRQGNYMYASHLPSNEFLYGAYNDIEIKLFDWLYAASINKQRRRSLTFNPDFAQMASAIVKFIIADKA